MPFTAQQLCQLATQATEPPATGRLKQVGQLLNIILSDLAMTEDLELTRGTFNFTLVSDNGSGNGMGPYPLPLNYWRHTKDGVFFTLLGVPYILTNYEQSEFDQLVVTAGLANYPEIFYTDISPLAQNPPSNPLMYVWQPSNGAYAMTVRYYKSLPDIVDPETSQTIPWFPNQTYLLTELIGRTMMLVGDKRAGDFLSSDPNGMGSGNQRRKFLQSQAADNEGRARTVGLDRRRFGSNFVKLPDTKAVGFFT